MWWSSKHTHTWGSHPKQPWHRSWAGLSAVLVAWLLLKYTEDGTVQHVSSCVHACKMSIAAWYIHSYNQITIVYLCIAPHAPYLQVFSHNAACELGFYTYMYTHTHTHVHTHAHTHTHTRGLMQNNYGNYTVMCSLTHLSWSSQTALCLDPCSLLQPGTVSIQLHESASNGYCTTLV